MTSRALVTGASRGIGKAISVALAGAGFDVALAARTLRVSDPTREHSTSVHHRDTRPLPGSIEETAGLVEAVGQKALALRLDLTDLDSVEAAMDLLIDEWGGVDVVVNNGRHIGPGHWDSILDTPIEQYLLYVMALGVAPIRMAQRLLPGMLERGGGTFVTISSGVAFDFYPPRGGPGLGYRIGKAAGHTLVGSILAEYGDQGIRGFNLDPGAVLTERHALDPDHFGSHLSWAPPAAIGAAVAWVVTSAEANDLQSGDIDARALVIERQLYPHWNPVST